MWISGTKQKIQFQTCFLILSVIMLQGHLLAHVCGKKQFVVGEEGKGINSGVYSTVI